MDDEVTLLALLEERVLQKRLQFEETKSNLEGLRYEIARMLVEFTKPITSDDPPDVVEKRLNQTLLQIGEKEEIENEILKEYYDSQIQYNSLLQEWREKVISIEEARRKTQSTGMDYQTNSKLIVWDEEEHYSPNWIGKTIPYSDLKYEESSFIGSGAFGSVFKGTVYHSPCAIKILNSTWNNQARESFLSEISTLSNLQHARILRFYGAVVEKDRLCLVTELAENGSIAERLFPLPGSKKHKKAVKKVYYELSPRRKLSLIQGIVEGMVFLHHHNVIHFDLKPENILLDEFLNPIIADFGLAKVFTIEDVLGLHSSVAGTLAYMGPELLAERPVLSPKVDVYAFGLIAYEIWVQERWNWEQTNPLKLFQLLIESVRPPFEAQRVSFPPSLKALLTKCWQTNPTDRPDFEQINKLDQLQERQKRQELKGQIQKITKEQQLKMKREISSLDQKLAETDLWMKISTEIAGDDAAYAGQMWRTMTRGDWMLWETFLQHYCTMVGLEQIDVEDKVILKAAFDIDQEVEKITFEQFIDYVKIFGISPNLSSLVALIHAPWYFGRISSAAAAVILPESATNRFLIRTSLRFGTSFVLSYRAKKGPVHHFLLTDVQDYTRLVSAMQNNDLLKKSLGTKAGLKPVDSGSRPPILTLACERYKKVRKARKKGVAVEELVPRGYELTDPIGDACRLDEFHGGFFHS